MLDAIINNKRLSLEQIDRRQEISKMAGRVLSLPPARSLKNSLSPNKEISLIAEIKRRSPSKGPLIDDLSVKETARIYENSGARGISVLTETEFFDGSIDDLKAAREITALPVLRKDFIIDPYQIWESRYIGADAILLIAGILDLDDLLNLHRLAGQIGLEVLVEVHDEGELEKALALNPEMIGINNRNLNDFNISLDVTVRLAPRVPDSITRISESGIDSRDDVLILQDCGIDAILVGESIIRSPDKGQKIRELLGKAND